MDFRWISEAFEEVALAPIVKIRLGQIIAISMMYCQWGSHWIVVVAADLVVLTARLKTENQIDFL